MDLLKEIRDESLTGCYKGYDERKTEKFLIDPVLEKVGWSVSRQNTKDGLEYQYQLRGGGKIDYVLKLNNKPKVAIEVKKVYENLSNHQDQVARYAFNEGIPIYVITSGLEWIFYLPAKTGYAMSKRVFCHLNLNIKEHKLDSLANALIEFLSMENIQSGKSLLRAENIFLEKERLEKIQKALPHAYEMALKDSIFLELLQEKVQEKCGEVPDCETLRKCLKKSDKKYINSHSATYKQPTEQTIKHSSSSWFITIEGKRFKGKGPKPMAKEILPFLVDNSYIADIKLPMKTGKYHKGKNVFLDKSKNKSPMRAKTEYGGYDMKTHASENGFKVELEYLCEYFNLDYSFS